MADEKESPTKVGDPSQPASATDAPANGEATTEESEGEMLSLENLDEIITEADPEFTQSLAEVGSMGSTADIYNEGVGLEYTLDDEMKLWEGVEGKKKILLKIFPFLPKLSFKLKMTATGIRLFRVKFKAKAIEFVKNIGPNTLKALKGGLSKVKGGISAALGAFGSFSLKKKLAFVGLLIATGGAIFLVQKIVRQGLIHENPYLFMGSFQEWSEKTYMYTPGEGLESFYDSLRTPQNMLQIEKMIVNLRRSETSGPTPMGAFEFIVEGAASDVVVEIKDREPEMRDLFQRTIEEMTFDQVSSGEGKQLLCEKIRKSVNAVLTRGKVRRIFIKTAIIKP